jgi:hypothetical protein
MNGPRRSRGMGSQFSLAFSLEEAPTFARGSSREKARMRAFNTVTLRGDKWPRLLGAIESAQNYGSNFWDTALVYPR